MPNDYANDHSDTVPMRGDAGDRMFATKYRFSTGAARLPSFRAAAMFPSFFHMADFMLTTSLIFSVVFFVAALVGLAICVYMAERLRLEHARDMIGGVDANRTSRQFGKELHHPA